MPGFTFQDMQKMQDEAAASLVDDLVPDFLSLFEFGKPLQRDAIDDWRSETYQSGSDKECGQ